MNKLPKLLIVLLSIMLFIFLLLTFKFLNINLKILTEHQKYNWKKTEAVINSIKLIKAPNPALKDDPDLYTVFLNDVCEIQYSYHFNKNQYTSNNIGFNKRRDTTKNATNEGTNELHRLLFQKLQYHKKIFIYVNPKHPEHATLIQYDFDYKKLGSTIITLSFSLLLIVLLYLNYKYPSNYTSNQIKLK
ncbi:DUF3592 domain-containing protein [Psychroserpens sp. NJDZ02]|uniref:DUF3592 domain-containing protein n=1 Tax=Psychroserpens sp. NJDZ02 TaxID=2570561 RepID=UPI0010A7E010|nr:hypothetical protein [Psychroserpens sp. NJDZ02]QCE41744.1 hypothetical protein E9099_10110 [Psychroserpens sp. NJDZ02]